MTVQQIDSFKRWALYWVQRYRWATEKYSYLDNEDLYQAAILGIMQALKTCTDEKTWAQWSSYFIRKEIRALIGIKNDKVIPPVPLSLDAPVEGEEDLRLADVLPDEPAPTEDETAERIQIQETVREAVASLKNARQREVVERWQLGGETQAELANEWNITRSRVNQLWSAARKHLQKNEALQKLIEDKHREELEDLTPYFVHVGSRRFNSTNTSAVELAVIKREEYIKRFLETLGNSPDNRPEKSELW